MTADSMFRNAPPASSDPRWRRVLARDRSADGTFWYSVVTTGVYCRPSCPSRAADRKNVRLHDSAQAAQASGMRPCRRCNPDGPSLQAENAGIVAKACRMIEQGCEPLPLAALADAMQLSPGYFHRLFKMTTGVTPRQYAAAHRAARVRDGLGRSASVTEAIYDAGFNASSRFYEQSTAMLGMTPTRYRAGGADETIRFAVAQCTLGAILVASSDKGVAAILIGDDPDLLVRSLQDRFARAALVGADGDYEQRVARVVGLVEAPALGLDLPLDVRGTAFQLRVWQALREIPAGHTATYADIAGRIGAPGSMRAVAGACAANTIAIAIPCHRVVRSDGALSGYRWGVERKRVLLAREAPAAPRSIVGDPEA